MSAEYIPRLKFKYQNEIVPQLSDKLSIANSMRVPKLVKVVLNVGIGDARDLFEALIIYTRVLRGYFQSIYKLNIAIADIEKIQP